MCSRLALVQQAFGNLVGWPGAKVEGRQGERPEKEKGRQSLRQAAEGAVCPSEPLLFDVKRVLRSAANLN